MEPQDACSNTSEVLFPGLAGLCALLKPGECVAMRSVETFTWWGSLENFKRGPSGR